MSANKWTLRLGTLAGISAFDHVRARAMPDFVEPLVVELIDDFEASASEERDEFLAAVSPGAARALAWYARRMAGRAVRESSPQLLWSGLVALAMAAPQFDFRDDLGLLALLYRSAEHLRVNPKELLARAATLTSTFGRETFFRHLIEGGPVGRRIERFGYSEGTGPQGFEYLPLPLEDQE